MLTRTLGTSGAAVPVVGLGCVGLTGFYGPADEDEARRTVRRALELGVRHFDTADFYGLGHNEAFLGELLRPRRREAFIATKCGFRPDGKGGSVIDARPSWIHSACDASLRRLQAEHIDLYYLHRVDPEVPIEESVGAMAALAEQGKVRFIGLSEAGTASIERAHEVHPIAAVQSEYSLWARDVERSVLPTLRRLGIAFVAYAPLGRGFLTGQIRDSSLLEGDDSRQAFPRFQVGTIEGSLGLVGVLEELAGRKRCTPAQVSLAWLLHQGDDVFVIPGTKRRRWLEQNVQAVGIQLSAEELKLLDEYTDEGFPGDRHPDMGRMGR